MQIDIQAHSFFVTKALRNHAERRLRFSLTYFDEHIQRVVMRLSYINGPRGRANKCCHLQVVLAGLPDVVVEDVQADLYVAIGRAANRAGRAVRRRLTRRRDRARTTGSHDAVSMPLDPRVTN